MNRSLYMEVLEVQGRKFINEFMGLINKVLIKYSKINFLLAAINEK